MVAAAVQTLAACIASQRSPNPTSAAVSALFATAAVYCCCAFIAATYCCCACRIAYAYDLIPQVPCAPRMMACAGNMFETTKRGISSWNYGKVRVGDAF
jgi:hypothetical protein